MPRPNGGLIDLALGGEIADLPALREWREITAEQATGAHQIVRRGDIWLLGEHRLLCGDSTNQHDVWKVLNGAQPHLLVSDPPYGILYNAQWRELAFGGKRSVGVVNNDQQADWTPAWRLFSGDVAYIWHAGTHSREVQSSLEQAGFDIRAQIIWVKKRQVLSRGHYNAQHEPCFYCVRKGKTAHWNGSNSEVTTWHIEHFRSDTGHSTQKPLECMAKGIRNNSQEGDGVYEPFSGSGTTIIAAESLRRKCYAIEIDPRYVYITLLRYQEQTGKSVTLEETGESFTEVVTRRKLEPQIQEIIPLGSADQCPASSTIEYPICNREVGGLNPPPGTNFTFDPVLAEFIYQRWSCAGANIIDPTPDPIRNAVASALGRTYNAPQAGALLVYCPRPQGARYALWLKDAVQQVRSVLAQLQPGATVVSVVEDAMFDNGAWCNAEHHICEVFFEQSFFLRHKYIVQDGQQHKMLFAFAKD